MQGPPGFAVGELTLHPTSRDQGVRNDNPFCRRIERLSLACFSRAFVLESCDLRAVACALLKVMQKS